MKISKFIILFGVSILLAGCNTFYAGSRGPVTDHSGGKYKKQGPPPHAPAHGYRHKHHGGDLEYNEQAGAYVVLNIPETYFSDNLYIRVSSNGEWLVSATLEGGWRVAAGNEIPGRLKEYKKYHKKDKKHKKKKK